MPVDLENLKQWVGRGVQGSDQVTPAPLVGLSATLDREDPIPKPGDPLPPLWHWLYFLSNTRGSEIGHDGHSERAGLLPPSPLPRRMWAGTQVQIHAPLRVGDAISRTSKLTDVRYKEGRTGPLLFLRTRHEIRRGAELALTEEVELVFRESPKPGDPAPQPQPAPKEHDWWREIRPDPVLLFRYSALTFNGHRIHYDRPYATQVEGYPGLVVHGPLIATLLLDLLRRNLPGATVKQIALRAVWPLFDTAPFLVCGRVVDDKKTVKLWAQDAQGWLAQEATVNIQ